MGQKNRHFSCEFKRDAVLLVTEKGMPVGKVARELDIHPNLLHLWRRRFLAQGDKAFVGRGRVRPEEAEMRALRKQLEKVRQERNFLKKPWPYSPNKAVEVSVYGGAQRRLPDKANVRSVEGISEWLLCVGET